MYSLTVKSKLSSVQKRAVNALIHDVWSYEQKVKGDVQMLKPAVVSVADPLDHSAVHVLVNEGPKLVGYGRLSLFENDANQIPSEVPLDHLNTKLKQSYAYISRLVIHPAARGRGLATLIDETRISIAKAYGVEVVLGCAVGDIRQQSLEKVGFSTASLMPNFQNPWYRTDRPVYVMQKHLDHTSQEQLQHAAGGR